MIIAMFLRLLKILFSLKINSYLLHYCDTDFANL